MMTKEQSQFAEDNIKLMYKYFMDNRIDDEDERAELMMFYCVVVPYYQEQKGKFSTLLYYSLDKYRQRIYNYNHKKCRYAENAPLSIEKVMEDDEDWLEKLISKDCSDFEEIELLDICGRVMARLEKKKTERTKKIENSELFSMLLNGYTRKEICERYHVSPQTVSVRIDKIKSIWNKEREEC